MKSDSELCHRGKLRLRHHERDYSEHLQTLQAPILWQYGAIARLKKGETIDKLLYTVDIRLSRWDTLGLLARDVTAHGKLFIQLMQRICNSKVMQRLTNMQVEWKAAENISYLHMAHRWNQQLISSSVKATEKI